MSDALPRPSKAPCGTCPYRRDIEPGIWDTSEYAKLPAYDGETFEQIINGGLALFYCHQNDGHLCAGWVGCHDANHLAAFRMNPVDPMVYDYVSPIPLFSSGREAAEHGMSGVDNPSRAAQIKIAKLEHKLKGQKKMSEFALRADDGDIHPEQVAYVDGYGIAERLLEGVRFKVELVSEEGAKMLACNGVHPDDEGYMAKFSSAQRAEWNAEAVKWLTENDGDATAEDGTNVHWGDA